MAQNAPDLNLTPMANWGFTRIAEERASRREFAHGAQSATGLLAAVILSRVVGQATTRRRR